MPSAHLMQCIKVYITVCLQFYSMDLSCQIYHMPWIPINYKLITWINHVVLIFIVMWKLLSCNVYLKKRATQLHSVQQRAQARREWRLGDWTFCERFQSMEIMHSWSRTTSSAISIPITAALASLTVGKIQGIAWLWGMMSDRILPRDRTKQYFRSNLIRIWCHC